MTNSIASSGASVTAGKDATDDRPEYHKLQGILKYGVCVFVYRDRKSP